MARPIKTLPSVERLREAFDYNPETGEIRWRINRKSGKAGALAGAITARGYLKVNLDGKPYQAHRVAWKYFYGEEPPATIDHVNRLTDDNRISNLRAANQNQQIWNQLKRSNGKSRLKGVYYHARRNGRKRWRATIKTLGRTIRLGWFLTREEAALAYLKAATTSHGDFLCVDYRVIKRAADGRLRIRKLLM